MNENLNLSGADYWVRNVRDTVRFSDCVAELLKDPERILLEVGPGQTLGALVRNYSQKGKESTLLSTMRHSCGRESDTAFLLNTLGRLWLAGIEVNWEGFYTYERRRRVPLPTYPFEHKRYWVEPKRAVTEMSPARAASGFTKEGLDDWLYLPSWKRCPLPPPGENRAALHQKGCLLIFLDSGGLGALLAGRLRQEGHRVITVKVPARGID